MGAQGALVTGWVCIFMMALVVGRGLAASDLSQSCRTTNASIGAWNGGIYTQHMYVLRVCGIIVGWPGQVMMQHFDS